MGLSIQTQNVNKLVYSLLISSSMFAQINSHKTNNLCNKYEKGSLGVPRMFWVPNTFPLHNQPPYPDLCSLLLVFVKTIRFLFAF